MPATAEVNAAALIREVLEGVGAGGGHREFAGGLIFREGDFDENRFFDKVGSLAAPWLEALPERYAP